MRCLTVAARTAVLAWVTSFCWQSPALGQTVAPTAAEAEPAPPAEPKNPEALRRVRQGQAASAAGRHQEALQAYKAADSIERTTATLRGVGEASEALGNPALAYAAYSELLKLLATLGGDPAERARVSQKLQALDARTGHLKVEISEVNAKVSVNGQVIGTTPLKEPVRLSNGVYTVSIQKEGFAEFRQQVTINHDEAVILGPLVGDPTQGSLAVRTRSGNPARLFLNKKEVGPLPWRGTVSAGQYDVEGRGDDGYSAAFDTVRIRAGDHKDVVLDLVLQSAELTVAAESGVDEILIDGFLVARGRFAGRVKPGRHRVEIRRTDTIPFVREIDIAPGGTLYVRGAPTPVPSGRKSDHEREREEDKDERGLYLRLFLNGTFGTSSKHDLATGDCAPKSSGGVCDSNAPLGGGGGGRLGFRFGALAIEGLAMWDVNGSLSKVTYAERATTGDFEGAPRLERYAIWRYGAALGGGLRFTTLTPGIRLSAGASAALAWHTIGYGRTVTPNATYLDVPIIDSSENKAFFSPLFVGDVGLTLGSSPGVQFVLGVTAMVEITPKTQAPAKDGLALGYEPGGGGVTQIPLESPELTLTQGMQIFWGPVLGLQFGY